MATNKIAPPCKSAKNGCFKDRARPFALPSDPPMHLKMQDCKRIADFICNPKFKSGLQAGMQSILALGLQIWTVNLSKRILMMPALVPG